MNNQAKTERSKFPVEEWHERNLALYEDLFGEYKPLSRRARIICTCIPVFGWAYMFFHDREDDKMYDKSPEDYHYDMYQRVKLELDKSGSGLGRERTKKLQEFIARPIP